MAANTKSEETFSLFCSNDGKPKLSLGFLDALEKPLPPLPPCIEVPFSMGSLSAKYTVEPLVLDGITLLKGRVSAQDIFSLSNSDLVPGKYEGGLKLWEGSLDLVQALNEEVKSGLLSFTGKRVLEIGCGHGLPGIFSCLQGASVVHFQDFNAEVLQHLTVPNVNVNLSNESQLLGTHLADVKTDAEIHFYAGDWSEIHQLLPYAHGHDRDPCCNSKCASSAGYDIILMAETVYSLSSLQNLYELIKKCVSYPDGVVYLAAKKYYFGVGGGTRRFLSVVEKDGTMSASIVNEVANGSSNVREVWKLSYKQRNSLSQDV